MSANFNVLVLEDDEFIVERMYRPQLTDAELDVDYVRTESEAKEKVRRKTYDVAYVDIMLADDPYNRGGIEFIRFLNDLGENTSVIVVSASDDIKVALSAYKAGIYDFLPKDSIHSAGEILAPLKRLLEKIKYQRTNSPKTDEGMDETDWRNVITDPVETKIFEALEDARWDWRTLRALSKASGLDPSVIRSILRKYPALVRRSSLSGPSGGELYTLQRRYFQRLSFPKKVLTALSTSSNSTAEAP